MATISLSIGAYSSMNVSTINIYRDTKPFTESPTTKIANVSGSTTIYWIP